MTKAGTHLQTKKILIDEIRIACNCRTTINGSVLKAAQEDKTKEIDAH